MTVRACVQAGTSVRVAWVVEAGGQMSSDPAEALALTPGGGRVGSVLAGALNDQVADLAAAMSAGSAGRLVDLEATEFEALVAGLPRGGSARCLVLSADTLPPQLWDLLVDREPVVIEIRLDGDRVIGATVYDTDHPTDDPDVSGLADLRESSTTVTDDRILTVLRPTPRLVVVGEGPIVEAILTSAQLLGWRSVAFPEPARAAPSIVGLSPLDKVVVVQHDVEAAGTALRAALSSRVGYIGALGGRRMQEARADWLVQHGVNDMSRIHGPAGLDIGARTPAEIAVSVLAEAIAVHAGSTAAAVS